MKGKKNLERAIILGLILSTGVYGSAWAEDETSGGLWPNADYKTEVPGNNLIITTQSIGVGYNGTVNVKNGDLTIDAGSNAVQSGYIQNAIVTILANEVVMNAGDNGIFTTTEEGYKSSVSIGSEDENITGLTITAGGQGIDNKNGNVYIYGDKNSTISISSTSESGDMENQAAINNAVEDGIVTVNGGSINLEAVGGNGITNGEKSIEDSKLGVDSETTLNSNSVTINASVNGVYNNKGSITLNTNGTNMINADENAVYNHGSGTININATNTSDISTFANYEDYNNVLIGDVNGVQSDSTGTTNVIADNDNTIVGTTNGILSDGAGTITVTAGNDNTIGQYTDENNVTHTSKTGIDVTQGTVNVTAGNDNYIYSDGEGDPAAGVSVHENGIVAIKATNGSNTINASYEGVNTDGTLTIYAKEDNTIKAVSDTGIQVGYNGYLELTAENGKNIISGGTEGVLVNSSAVISANDNNEITGGDLETQIGSGINSVGGSLELTSISGNNIIKGGYSGISVDQGSQIDLSALQGINSVVAFGVGNGIYGNATSIIDLEA